MKKYRFLWWLAPLAAVALTVGIWLLCHITQALTIGRYEVGEGDGAGLVIAHISDLHSCRYGDGMAELTAAVDGIAPDIVCLTGDIFDDDLPCDNSLTFLAAIAAKYPCYYVTGNHEHRRDPAELADLLSQMEALGIHLLRDSYEIIEVRGRTFCLAGVWGTDPEAACYAMADTLPADVYTILLCHYPELTAALRASGADLVLCGHAHGGQWRLRASGEGLIAPGEGLFPHYSGGLYELGDSCTMIVSRGLARESHPMFRVNNAPEAVAITIH